MKSPITKVKALGALFLTVLVQAGTQPSVEPRSGIIVSGNQKVWFDGNMTRIEALLGTQSMILVTGDGLCWTAFPQISRVQTNILDRPHWRSYQEQARSVFSRTTDHVRVGEEEFLGLPCWKYEWVETNRPHAFMGGGGAARRLQMLFLANPSFPLLMRMGSEGTWNTNADVQRVELDVPIPSGTFDVPREFKVTNPFQLPREPFQLLVQQTRSSQEFGWSTITTTLYSGDGDKITESCTSILRDENGGSTNGPVETAHTPEQATAFLYYPVGTAMWEWGKRTGVDRVLGFDAEVFETADPKRRYWIVDHPQFGSFTARFVLEGDTPETNEVVRIEVGE